MTGIDTATLEPAAPVAFGVPGGGLDLIAGGDRLYVLDHARRTASAVEPGTLRVLAQAAVGVVPGPGQAVVDDDGRLWLIDAAAGGITVLDGSTGELTTSGAADPTSRLVLVDGRPLLVDVPGSRLAVPGDDANGSCLAIQAGDDVRAAAAGSDLFVAVRQSGSVLVARAGDAGCGAALPAGSPGDRYGDIVVSGRFAFVPNLTEGSVYVIDGGAPQRPVGRFPIGVPGNRLQLLAAEGVDGLVFYNDLDSERAGVLRLQGGVWLAGQGVRKFNPVDPSDGLFVPAVGNDDPAPEIAAAPDIVGAPPVIASEPPTSESRPTTPEPSTVSSTASAAPSTTTSTEPADTSAPVSTDDPAPAEPAVAPTTAPVSPPAATTAPAPTTTTPTTPPTADPTATAAPTTTPPTTATPPPATTAPITTTLTAPPPAGLRDVTETTVTAPALVPFKSTFTLSVEVSNAGGEIRPSGSVTVTRVGNGTSTVLGTFRLVSSRVEVNLSAPFLGPHGSSSAIPGTTTTPRRQEAPRFGRSIRRSRFPVTRSPVPGRHPRSERATIPEREKSAPKGVTAVQRGATLLSILSNPVSPANGSPAVTETAPPQDSQNGGQTAWFAQRFDELSGNVESFIRGKPDVVRMALVCMLAEGHLLIDDVPGIGKTSLAKAISQSIDGSMRRIQFTPDLLPSDVTGVQDLRPGQARVRLPTRAGVRQHRARRTRSTGRPRRRSRRCSR